MNDIERGIKRIVWVISVIGILILATGIVFGTYNSIKRAQTTSRMEADQRWAALPQSDQLTFY